MEHYTHIAFDKYLQGLKRMDARQQQQGMDPFGGMFEAFGFGGK